MGFKRSSTGICLLGLLPGLIAWAQTTNLYRYQDDSGVVVVDWRVPAEYVDHGYEVLDETGRVLRVVPRALTDSEKRDASKARDLEVEAIAEQERLQAWDESLLLRYSTTEDIEAARDRALRDLRIRVSILKSNRRSLRQQAENAQARVAESERLGNAPRPEDLDYIADVKREIDGTERQIAEREAQIEVVSEEYQLDIDRFQQLQDVVALRQSMERNPD
jgi:hypothetical protein